MNISSHSKFSWILAHRGIWHTLASQNTGDSIESALLSGFGVETDIRDFLGVPVVSHDPIKAAESLHKLNIATGFRFALNIKQDGLSSYFVSIIDQLKSSDSFVFDGSIPEMYKLRNLGIPHALRLSEFEKELPWEPDYVWVDGFESDWWIKDPKISELGKKYHLVFVSPELHGRAHTEAFNWFADLKSSGVFDFSVCTDHPMELKNLANV